LEFGIDGGGEYTCGYFYKFCKAHRDIRQKLQHPQQNSIAERKNHTMFQMATCMLKGKGKS
jgi:hypothetical protein